MGSGLHGVVDHLTLILTLTLTLTLSLSRNLVFFSPNCMAYVITWLAVGVGLGLGLGLG